MCGLGHVRGMHTVVVRHVSVVVSLQREQERQQRVRRNLERLEQVPFLV